ncbi:MAG TPA: adenylate/guanylate cyclase domain-containing protein, partial [Armatimonadota bacterium]|nr:adenylate/guanylate cyclase domain-containing protein [Armatimonadota bacterium]
MSSRRTLYLFGALIGLVMGLLATWLASPRTHAGILSEALLRAKLISYDYRMAYCRPLEVSPDIAIVTIDEESLSQPELSVWPWPRRFHAQVLRNLAKAGARLIAMDIIFQGASSNPAEQPPEAMDDIFYEPPLSEDDKELIAALRETGNVILAMELVEESVGDQEGGGELSVANFPHADFEDAALGLAAINLPKDLDGTVRRCITQVVHQDEFYPTMAVRLAALYTGREVSDVRKEVLARSGSGHPGLPADSFLIRFRAPIGRGFARIPYYQALEGYFDPAAVAGKIVFIGASARALQDLHRTPMYMRGISGTSERSAPMPGVEILASATDTIISRNWVRPAPQWVPLLLAVLFCVAMGMLTVGLRPVKALPLGWLPLVTIATLITFRAFWRTSTWIPVEPILLGVTLAYVSSTVYLELTAQRTERQLRQAWARRVSPEVLSVILNTPGLTKVEGRVVEGTVFFSDLRSFTTFCHSTTPERVVQQVNKYLGIATDVIRKHGGTVLKFIGDGVMAVFGDPVFQEDHARRALAASAEIQEEMLKLRSQAGPDDWPMFVRIGLHTGELVAGDIGSGLLEYTVMGDTVSTASRLE